MKKLIDELTSGELERQDVVDNAITAFVNDLVPEKYKPVKPIEYDGEWAGVIRDFVRELIIDQLGVSAQDRDDFEMAFYPFRDIDCAVENPKPAMVRRDSMGYWVHPVFEKEEYDGMSLAEIPEVQGMEFWFRDYRFVEGAVINPNGQTDVSGWKPQPPEGEGWFLGGIYENENGIYAMFMRPKQEKVG